MVKNINMILYSGLNYNYEVVLETVGSERNFYIRAIDIQTGRYSSINNLNMILNELYVDIENPRYHDSLWSVEASEIYRLRDTAVSLLSDLNFIRYLEDHLDEDRRCGEWENLIGRIN